MPSQGRRPQYPLGGPAGTQELSYRYIRISALLVLSCVLLSACGAYYATSMKGSLKRLQRRDYEAALEKLEKPTGDTNKLLYRLERGLILHYQGEWIASNAQFEKAERLIDRLYTKSASREVTAFLTNDAIRPYTGAEFERIFIHYYRSLNYLSLGDRQASLVEARKANLRLSGYARDPDYELSYRNDAFIQYVTGLLYEAEGEWNDAYVSYRAAEKGFNAYAESFGIRPPRQLGRDLLRAAAVLGFDDDLALLADRYGFERTDHTPTGAEAIVFVESGMIARKRETEISIPITEADNPKRVQATSRRALKRYRHSHGRYHSHRIKYWLKVALPYYESRRSRVQAVRISAGEHSITAELVEDLDAIAFKTLEDKEDTILLRTIARALAKYTATKAAEKESSFLGALVNLFGATTEAADTRSWLSLPARIHMARLKLPPGTVDLLVELLDSRGNLVEEQLFPDLTVTAGRPLVLSHRSFQ